jgi:hypothetical protein
MKTSGSTYPQGSDWNAPLAGVPVGRRDTPTKYPYPVPASEEMGADPSVYSGAVLGMMPFWQTINVVIGGTKTIRANAETIIPREPEEPDDAYQRRIFHAVMPPFLQRLAAQAAGTILRKGIHLEGGDEEYWSEWVKDVTGDGTPLNEFARRLLVDALLYGHTCAVVDYPDDEAPRTLLEERQRKDRQPYLIPISAQQVLGWRTSGNRSQGRLDQVRYFETVVERKGKFAEDVIEQIRVLEPGRWEVWRRDDAIEGRWKLHASGTTPLEEIPLVAVYSNRLSTLVSRPPLLEVANLNIAYCQRFTDYHHAIHVGAQPILVLKGFDEDSGRPIGLSVNTAVLLPPDGDAMYVEPTADAYESQLKCLQTMEDQISNLGISTLARQNLTNAAAEAKRLDRIDSDSIMSIISEDLARAIEVMLKQAAEYAGKEPPTVSIPRDYENRLIDGNQITAYLQLFMQGAIDQETLLRILQEGEVLPAYIDIQEVITKAQDYLDEQMAREVEKADELAAVQAEHAPDPVAPGSTSTSVGAKQGGVASGKAGKGSQTGSSTLPTPLRPGKHKSK